MKNISQAIQSIYGEKEGLCTKAGKISAWPYDEPQPSEEEVLAIVNKYNADNEHKEKIKAEMPSADEQFEILYELGLDGWKQTVKAIRDKHPKPE